MQENLNVLYRIIKSFHEDLVNSRESDGKAKILGICRNPQCIAIKQKMLDDAKRDYIANGGKRNLSKFI